MPTHLLSALYETGVLDLSVIRITHTSQAARSPPAAAYPEDAAAARALDPPLHLDNSLREGEVWMRRGGFIYALEKQQHTHVHTHSHLSRSAWLASSVTWLGMSESAQSLRALAVLEGRGGVGKVRGNEDGMW